MKLITEQIDNVQCLTESVNGKKTYFIEGIFLQADKKNRNGRIYPLNGMLKEVTRYTNDFVNKGRALGELGHPEGPQLNLERVSHKIIELRQEGSNFRGKAQILDTPYGNIVKNLIDGGVQLGVSSRALGSLRHDPKTGANIVQEDLYIATAADIVADPSAPDAMVQGIVENKEWVVDGGLIKEYKIEEYKRIIQSTRQRKLEEAKLRIFADYLKQL